MKKTTKKTRAPRKARRYWSAKVTERSDALDLEPSVFKRSPAAIAGSLKRSAERSTRRKSSPFRSAMSMLSFYQNRAGKNLSAAKKQTLLRAKEELRKLYGR
jgi:predicted ATPase